MIAIVPGCFEIPLAARKMADGRKDDALVCLGVLIRGGAIHFDLIAGKATKGVSNTSWQTVVSTAFGIIATETIEQAIKRSGCKAGNKSEEVTIEMENMLKNL